MMVSLFSMTKGCDYCDTSNIKLLGMWEVEVEIQELTRARDLRMLPEP